MSRKISQVGIRLIQNFEGCRLTAYKPVATEKYWTIGWGHYGPDVKQGTTITQAQADAMLIADLAKYEAYVNNPAYVPVTEQLNQNQFDALVSFCYNCGAGNLRKLCKGRTVAQIVQAIPLYDKAGGKVLAGLTKRRKAEVALFNKPVEAKEEDDKLELSNYQWQSLRNGVSELIANGKITDKTWLDKIDKRTLTVSELSWLTFTVATR
ncbi:hypothetical protein J41TS12_39490 [Paenibacillus antibioticophila]|uniref:Lysozyme n=1 Tax=Paenibacillus antibioticophila TaxID=1274374 RepID=A0A920CIU4_9BACL|nr:lysozyme [Paenibacillus antibioticophila]GIO39088.1 hypothetical protein J41TS12_39490 [Paenibacillus antibioticophila]